MRRLVALQRHWNSGMKMNLLVCVTGGILLQEACSMAVILYPNSLFPPLAGSGMQTIFWPFWETPIKIKTGQKNFPDIHLPRTFLTHLFTILHLSTHLWHFQVQSEQDTCITQYYKHSTLLLGHFFSPLSGKLNSLIYEGPPKYSIYEVFSFLSL